jgi:hypothetical protein
LDCGSAFDGDGLCDPDGVVGGGGLLGVADQRFVAGCLYDYLQEGGVLVQEGDKFLLSQFGQNLNK